MAFPTRNSAVPVGVAIGVALVVALESPTCEFCFWHKYHVFLIDSLGTASTY